ncbi:hypothetical protein GCM10009107_21020 [Ideonella azotifigens]|uniref:Uncharacterized protein n=1 Tax=Ideonella azotifigens TaxID=513160 RepID=A0ABP3V6S0_9BURK
MEGITLLDLLNAFAHPFQPRQPIAFDVRRDEDVVGSTDKKATGNNAYVAGIGTVVSVVAKEEVAVRRNGDRSKASLCLNGRQELDGPFASFDPFRRSQAFGGAAVVHRFGDTSGSAVLCGRSVDKEYFVSHFHDIAGHSDESLDQADTVHRRREGDYIATLRASKFHDRDVGQRNLEVIRESIDKDDVSFQKSWAHGARRYGIPIGHG